MESTLVIATGVTAIPTVILAVATVFLALSTRRSAQASEKVIAANRDMVTENRRMVEVNHEMVEEMRAGCIAQEQPHVIVDLGFKGDLLDLVIRNVGRGIAKNIELASRRLLTTYAAYLRLLIYRFSRANSTF